MVNIPKGTKDMLPSEAYKWHYVENIARQTARMFGFKEIRTPIFEYTELFLRGVGETTDIVSKEMYTFLDKGNRSITLRPEGTAGVARCFIENGLHQGIIPLKTYYLAPVFRYEKPQNGRLRQHHQFGVEMFGSDHPSADAEIIILAQTFLKNCGLSQLELNINSIGCKHCRAKYNDILKEFLLENIQSMCALCNDRLDKNPLRIIDCKETKCSAINVNAPKILDYLCGDCDEHFKSVQNILLSLGVNFNVNANIVRGLDYYTKTVFEIVSSDIGAQGTVCGGGRYNHLVEQVGGKPMPAMGFGLGLERLLLVLENTNNLDVQEPTIDLYIASIGEDACSFSRKIVKECRENSISAEFDMMQKSLKAQMRYADKIKSKYVIVLGETEIASNVVNLKNMLTGEVDSVDIDNIVELMLELK